MKFKFNKSAKQIRRKYNKAKENFIKTGDAEYAVQIDALSTVLSSEYSKGVM